MSTLHVQHDKIDAEGEVEANPQTHRKKFQESGTMNGRAVKVRSAETAHAVQHAYMHRVLEHHALQFESTLRHGRFTRPASAGVTSRACPTTAFRVQVGMQSASSAPNIGDAK
jgi:hypothetical protein